MKEKKTDFLNKFWGVFVIESFLFSLTLVLGIATAHKSHQIVIIQKIEIPQVSFWQFIVQFFIATIFILLIIRITKFRKQKELIFRALFVLAVFSGGFLLLSIWFSGIIPLVLIIALIVSWWKKPSILLQNACVILAIAGIGSVLGPSFNPETITAFLIIFSIYDVIAVYKTKHMVEMAKEMIKSRAILGLVIPPNIFGFSESLKNIEVGGKFLVLGGGDIIFPLLLCSSLIPFGLLKSLIVGFFSLIGLLVSFYLFLSQKKRRPIPALPPIALFSIIGFLIVKIL